MSIAGYNHRVLDPNFLRSFRCSPDKITNKKIPEYKNPSLFVLRDILQERIPQIMEQILKKNVKVVILCERSACIFQEGLQRILKDYDVAVTSFNGKYFCTASCRKISQPDKERQISSKLTNYIFDLYQPGKNKIMVLDEVICSQETADRLAGGLENYLSVSGEDILIDSIAGAKRNYGEFIMHWITYPQFNMYYDHYGRIEKGVYHLEIAPEYEELYQKCSNIIAELIEKAWEDLMKE